jgi:ribosomal protein S20
MPIIKSAKKRVRTAEKAAIRNSKSKRSLKGAIKAFHKAITGGENSAETQAVAQSHIDRAAKKGLMHKNKAARQKAQLARAAKLAATSDAPVKKAAAKKPTAGKTAKPAAAKKAPAKTTAGKKAAPAKVAAPKKTTAKAAVKAPAKKPAAKK